MQTFKRRNDGFINQPPDIKIWWIDRMKSINLTHNTHQKLSNLKKSDETFDDVISRLLDMEDKFNPKDPIVCEYEWFFSKGSRVFQVSYGDIITIKYYSKRTNSFESNIKAWNSKGAVPEEELNSFISFIVKESNLYVLYEMEDILTINNIHIERVG